MIKLNYFLLFMFFSFSLPINAMDTSLKEKLEDLNTYIKKGQAPFIDLVLGDISSVEKELLFKEPLILKAINARTLNALVVKKLLENGANPNQNQPIIEALNRQHTSEMIKIIKLLLEDPAINLNINLDSKTNNPLIKSLEKKWPTNIIQLIIEKTDPSNLNVKNRFGQTALALSLLNRYEDVSRLLIEKGADINMTSQGSTPLHIALLGNTTTELLTFMIQHGAQLDNNATPEQKKKIEEITKELSAKKGLSAVEQLQILSSTLFSLSQAKA